MGAPATDGGLSSPRPAIWGVFARFVHAEVRGSILLLASTVVALAWANSPWRESYDNLKSPIRPQRFVEIVRSRLPELDRGDVTRQSLLLEERQLDTVLELHEAAANLRPPGLTLERLLHPVQAYVVLPLFALF